MTAPPAPIVAPVITWTAITKAAQHSTRLKPMTRGEALAWLRAAMASGVEVDPKTMHPDIRARAILLPPDNVTDFGDRMVAVCALDQRGTGEYVVTTVKPLRTMLVNVKHEDPEPEPEPKRAPAVKPAPRPVAVARTPEPKAGRYESRGAQMARSEIARRRLVLRSVAYGLRVGGRRVGTRALNNVLQGRIPPTMAMAVALRELLGVPLELWGDPVAAPAPAAAPRNGRAAPKPRKGSALRRPPPEVMKAIEEIAALRRKGLSIPEISARLGIPQGTVTSKSWRARQLGISTEAEL